MDGNEAIQIVKEAFSAYESDYRCIGENAKWDNIHEALDLAIEALKEPKPVEDAISRQAVEEMIKAELPERGMWEIEGDKEKETVCEVCFDLMQKLSELPPVDPPKKVVAQIKVDIDELMERIKEEYKITDRPVCEDAISKHDLWRIIEDNAYWVTYNETSKEKGMTLTGINQALNECPPVQPKRPKGMWIGEGDGYADGGIVYDTWYCSECDHCEEGEEFALPNFCPDCGCDCRGDK